MILRFYLVALVLMGSQLALALRGGSKETVRRAWTLIVLLHVVCLAVWIGPLAVGVLGAAILALSWRELGGGVVLLLALGLWFAAMLRWPSLLAVAAPLGAVAALLALTAGPRLTRRSDFATAFGLTVAATGAAGLVRLAGPNPAPLLALLLLVQLNDAFAYLAGKRFGRTRLFPATSPNKSAEGYAGGAVALLLGIALLHTAVLPLLRGVGPGGDAALFAFVLVFANLGDLGLSALKRGRGVKDFGSVLPGHGGVLDRFGNILLAAPLFALLWGAL